LLGGKEPTDSQWEEESIEDMRMNRKSSRSRSSSSSSTLSLETYLSLFLFSIYRLYKYISILAVQLTIVRFSGFPTSCTASLYILHTVCVLVW
jgi:hypothetical protein